MKVHGPYETERDTFTAPMPREITSTHPARGVAAGSIHIRLLDACREYGVELGAYDFRILAWLAGWEASTAQVVIGLISRAYAAGAAANTDQPSREPDAAAVTSARADELAAVLDEVLRTFTVNGHPGRACLQSGWVEVERVHRWRQVRYAAPAALPAVQAGPDSRG